MCQFKKLPSFLFSEYKDLSSDAKILYAVLSDRKSLSEKNGWVDENGTYIIFTVNEVGDYIPSSKAKASRIMKELRDSGLIERKRMGQGKADRIYVMEPSCAKEKDIPVKQKVNSVSSVEHKSSINETLKLSISAPNNTDYIYTDSEDQSALHEDYIYLRAGQDGENEPTKDNGLLSAERVIKNTGLDELQDDPVNEILRDIIIETMVGKDSDTIRLNGADKPRSIIRSCFSKLDRKSIDHFVYRLANHTDLSRVKNKRSYIRSMLYNSFFEAPFGPSQEEKFIRSA